MVYEIFEHERDRVEAAVERHVDALLAASPRGFETYTVAKLPREEVASLFSSYDLDEAGLDMLRDEVGSLAVAYLRRLEAEGVVRGVSAQGGSPALRQAMRDSSHPLLRLLADAEFGCARSAEVEAAMKEAEGLPGWDAGQPVVVAYPI